MIPTKEQKAQDTGSKTSLSQSKADRQIPAHVVAIQRFIDAADWGGFTRFVGTLNGVELNEPIKEGNTVVHYVTGSGDLGE